MQKLTTPFSEGFAAITTQLPKCLVLGSMPGVASIEAQQYYAHPRNAFWPIVSQLLGFDGSLPYNERCAALANHGVFLWDVLHQAQRPGSLDSAINTKTMVVNDFRFLCEASSVEVVFCNGGKAYQLFDTKVKKPLSLDVPVVQLPSTSPAYAAITLDKKYRQWQLAFEQFNIV